MFREIIVKILEGKVPAADLNGKSDPYVIVSIPNSNFQYRTKTITGSLTPVWNEIATFSSVNIFNPGSNVLKIQIWDKDTFTRDDFLGEAVVPDLEKFPDEEGQALSLNLVSNGNVVGSISVKVKVNKPRDFKSAKALEEYLVAEFNRTGKKFEDPEFPTTDNSLYKNPPGEYQNVQWKRPSEFCKSPELFISGVESGDVIQGALGDCYFLGALSVVATRNDLLYPLFVSAHPEAGFYQIKFWKNGAWRVVTIDDRIPMWSDTEPVFGKCKDANECWVMFMEKAYAKLHGCYEAIESGSIASALTDLTGESNQIFTLTDENTKKQIQNGLLWQQLVYFVSESFLMGCSHNAASDQVEQDTGMGILKNHAYGLLDCKEPEPGLRLLCLRNPWGRLEWRGRYSDNSKEWTPSLIQKLNVKFEDDGTFWMCFEDFIVQFNQIIVLTLLNDEIGKVWTKFSFADKFKGASAGGSTNHVTWHDNPQFGLKNTHNGPNRLFVSLSQPDVRVKWEQQYKIPLGLYIFKTKNSRLRKLGYELSELVARTSFMPSRDVAVTCVLEPQQEYVVIPATYDPNQQTKFWLDIYAEEPITSQKVEEEHMFVVKSEWKGPTAGGCHNNPNTWLSNPKFLIKPTQQPTEAVRLAVILRQPVKTPLQHIGLYNGHWDGKLDKFALAKAAKPCVNAKEFSLDIILNPSDWPWFVMPHTFDAGIESSFEVIVHCKIPVQIEYLHV